MKKHLRYDIGQKVQVHGIPFGSPDIKHNFKLAEVHALPGWNVAYPEAYGIVFSDGCLRPAMAHYLRLDPNKPTARTDANLKSSWASFEAITGISAAMIRSGNRNPDY